MNLIHQIITSCFKFQRLQCQWLCFPVGATLEKGVGKELLFIATLHRIGQVKMKAVKVNGQLSTCGL